MSSDMLSYRLCRLLEAQAAGLVKLEHIRRMLVEQSGFSSYALFKHVSGGKDHIERDDLSSFLSSDDFFLAQEDLAGLVNRYTKNGNLLSIGYQDFFLNLEFPKMETGLDALNSSRYRNSLHQTKIDEENHRSQIILLMHKMQTEVLIERNIQVLKQLLADEAGHDFYDTFRRADFERCGYLSYGSFKSVLDNHGVKLSDKELRALFKQYDVNQDGKISYLEFLTQILPANSSFIGSSPRKVASPSKTFAFDHVTSPIRHGPLSASMSTPRRSRVTPSKTRPMDMSFDFPMSPRERIEQPNPSFFQDELNASDVSFIRDQDLQPSMIHHQEESKYFEDASHMMRASQRDRMLRGVSENMLNQTTQTNQTTPAVNVTISPRKRKCVVGGCILPQFHDNFCSIHSHSNTSVDWRESFHSSSPSKSKHMSFTQSFLEQDISIKQLKRTLEHEFEEIRRRLALHPSFTLLNAFEHMDADKDGYITVTELGNVMVSSGYRLSADELSNCMVLFDSNGDGRISYAEFISKMMPSNTMYSDLVTTSGSNARARRKLSIPAQVELAQALKCTIDQKSELDDSMNQSIHNSFHR